jgi:hypothetical protein
VDEPSRGRKPTARNGRPSIVTGSHSRGMMGTGERTGIGIGSQKSPNRRNDFFKKLDLKFSKSIDFYFRFLFPNLAKNRCGNS